jgi:hypothetical protein
LGERAFEVAMEMIRLAVRLGRTKAKKEGFGASRETKSRSDQQPVRRGRRKLDTIAVSCNAAVAAAGSAGGTNGPALNPAAWPKVR